MREVIMVAAFVVLVCAYLWPDKKPSPTTAENTTTWYPSATFDDLREIPPSGHAAPFPYALRWFRNRAGATFARDERGTFYTEGAGVQYDGRDYLIIYDLRAPQYNSVKRKAELK